MCIAIPMQVQEITWPTALVNAGGVKQYINIQLVPEIQIGDFAVVHAGFAIQIMSKEQAKETANYLLHGEIE